MAGCQNYGPFLGTLNIRGRIIIRTQEGAVNVTTTHILNLKPNCCPSKAATVKSNRKQTNSTVLKVDLATYMGRLGVTFLGSL